MPQSLDNSLRRLDAVICLLLGASFHVLATPHIAGVEMRVGMSDMMLGVSGALFVVRMIAGSTTLLPVDLRKAYLWLGAVFALLAVGYFRAGIFDDSSAVWARIKLAGFVVLSGYFVVGSWIGTNLGAAGAVAVARGFVAAAWVSAVLGLVEYGAYFYFDYPITWIPRIAALAENPNAYGIMLAAALALDYGCDTRLPLFGERATLIGRSLTLVAVFLSASRSAYVGVVFALIGLAAFCRVPLRRMIPPFLAAAAVFVLLFVAPRPIMSAVRPVTDRVFTWVASLVPAPSTAVGGGGARSQPATAAKDNFAVTRNYADQGLQHRLDLFQQARMMWSLHPVLGGGLGAFWRSQQARNLDYPFINHNTTLWLASELGLIGLVLVLGGVARTGYVLLRNAGANPMAAGVAGMLCVLVGASAGTEVFYQRYTWCFCGLALALVALARRTTPQAPAQ